MVWSTGKNPSQPRRAERPRREESFPAHTRWQAAPSPWTPPTQRTEEAERQAERGTQEVGRERETGQWWLGGRGWRPEVVAAPTRSVSQHHPAVQGHGHGAIQLILAGIAVVPASHNVICSAISACFCRAADSPRTVVAEQVRRGLSRHQRRSLHSRDSSRPNVLCVQTAHRPRFSRTVRVSCFCRTANAVGRWIGVPPRDNCGPFRLPLRYSPPRLAVSSDRMRRSPQSTVVFSLHQTMLVLQLPVVVVAGCTRCASYECRHHHLDRPATVRVGGGRDKCRA